LNKKNKASATKAPKILKENKFSPLAIEIVKKLKQSGFQGYLVGGCVRDSLVGIKAKDFDVSTDATPEEVRKLFRSSRIIGKRFRLVHVFSRNELIEVSTFRANTSNKDNGSGVIKDAEGKIRSNMGGWHSKNGLENDYDVLKVDQDGLEQKIIEILEKYIPEKGIVSKLEMKMINYKGHDVYRIIVKPNKETPRICFRDANLKAKGNKPVEVPLFYVRVGNTSRPQSPQEFIKYWIEYVNS